MAQFSQRGVLWVVVLGDFGRSPRMQYHCLSLIRKYDVNIHVFAQSNNLQGVIPELLDARLRTAQVVEGHVNVSVPSRRATRLLLRWFAITDEYRDASVNRGTILEFDGSTVAVRWLTGFVSLPVIPSL
jgi:hypothetical protein